MKKILGLTVTALLVMGLVGGGTWAYFSDTETSTNNVLTAGTLDLNIDGGNVAVTTLSIPAAYPGDSGNGSSILANVGSISGELDIVFGAVSNNPGTGGTEFEGGSGELGAVATMAVFVDVDSDDNWSSGDIGLKSDATTYSYPTALDYATIDSYSSDNFDAVQTMAVSASENFYLLYSVPTSAGNSIQGDNVTVDITFDLQQPAAD